MIKGNLPSSALHATLDDFLWTSKYRLQKCKSVGSVEGSKSSRFAHSIYFF